MNAVDGLMFILSKYLLLLFKERIYFTLFYCFNASYLLTNLSLFANNNGFIPSKNTSILSLGCATLTSKSIYSLNLFD